jgi:hypothetical protein
MGSGHDGATTSDVAGSTSVRNVAWKRLITLLSPTVKQISMSCSCVKCSDSRPKSSSPMGCMRVDRWAYSTTAASAGA